MQSRPVPGDARRRRAEGQFKSSKKADLKLRCPTIAYEKLRRRKQRGCAPFVWRRKRPTRMPPSVRPQEQLPARPTDADPFEELKPQIRRKPSEG